MSKLARGYRLLVVEGLWVPALALNRSVCSAPNSASLADVHAPVGQ
jgi:hypothetical protein